MQKTKPVDNKGIKDLHIANKVIARKLERLEKHNVDLKQKMKEHKQEIYRKTAK